MYRKIFREPSREEGKHQGPPKTSKWDYSSKGNIKVSTHLEKKKNRILKSSLTHVILFGEDDPLSKVGQLKPELMCHMSRQDIKRLGSKVKHVAKDKNFGLFSLVCFRSGLKQRLISASLHTRFKEIIC